MRSIKVTAAKACESYKEHDTFLSGGMGGAAPVPNLIGRSPYLTGQVYSPRKSGAGNSFCKNIYFCSRTLRSTLFRKQKANTNWALIVEM